MFLRNRFFFIFVNIYLSCLVLTSCTNTSQSGHIFHYNESGGIPTLDPAFAKNQAIMWPVHQLFNTLVETNDSLQVVPSLAKNWNFSGDLKTLTFTLRTDVFFHDDACFPQGKGRRMVAADVVYSLSRIIDPKTASPGAWIFHGNVDSLHPFTALNDSTLQIRLSQPCVPILGIFTMPYCSVVPKEAILAYGNGFGRHPVGTGPFKFKVWHENEVLSFSKNTHYFEKDDQGNMLPYLQGVSIRFLESKAAEFMEFRQHHLDFVNDLDPAFKDQLLTHSAKLKKEWEGKVLLHLAPYLNVEYLGIKASVDEGSPLHDVRVRRAMSQAIDRKKLLYYLRNSIGTPAEKGFVPPSLMRQEVSGYAYDTAAAKKLLQEAGYDARLPAHEIRLVTMPTYGLIGNFIVAELNKIGMKATLETMQKSLLLEKMASGQLTFFRGSWIADYPDASNYLGVFYGKNPAPPNYTHYANPKYDELFEQALREADVTLRNRQYYMLDSMILRDAQVIPLWYDRVMHIVQPNVRGFQPTPMNMLELRKVRKV